MQIRAELAGAEMLEMRQQNEWVVPGGCGQGAAEVRDAGAAEVRLFASRFSLTPCSFFAHNLVATPFCLGCCFRHRFLEGLVKRLAAEVSRRQGLEGEQPEVDLQVGGQLWLILAEIG